MKKRTDRLSQNSILECLDSIINNQENQLETLRDKVNDYKEQITDEWKQETHLDYNHSYFSVNNLNQSETEVVSKDVINQNINEITENISTIENNTNILRQLQGLFSDRRIDILKLYDQHNLESDVLRYKVLDALETDRKRIACDLHDSTVQLLTMLVHKAELCEKLVSIDANRTKLELNSMMNSLKVSINDLRSTIYNLRPMSIDDLGLIPTLERHLLLLKQNSDIQFLLEVCNCEPEILPVIKLSLYRIIQEACNNIVKHSKASKALIKIEFTKDTAELWIEDNGVGITHLNDTKVDVEAIESDFSNHQVTRLSNEILSGFGLSILEERVYLLYGKLKITTSNRGTSIHVSVPISYMEEENYETDKDNHCR